LHSEVTSVYYGKEFDSKVFTVQYRTSYLKSLVITKGDKIMQIGHV